MKLTLAKCLTAGLLLVGLQVQAAESDPAQIRISHQKGSVSMVLAKSHQLLEKRFPHTKIQWIEFPAGPQMLEALNVNSIDLGSTGDLPPLFAQAAGADLLYVGSEPPKPQAEVILVPKTSPLKQVTDLKGKKVAFQKGSSSYNLLLRALQQAGLSFKDITPVYLTPADARAAFQQGNVDAWAIWDPLLLLGAVTGQLTGAGRWQQTQSDRVVHLTGSFYLATRSYAEAHGAFIQQVLDIFSAADALTLSQRPQSITLLAQAIGLPEPVIASYRPPTTITPVSDKTAVAQQHTADLFYANHLLPVKVSIRERIWQPHTVTQ